MGVGVGRGVRNQKAARGAGAGGVCSGSAAGAGCVSWSGKSWDAGCGSDGDLGGGF